MILIVFGLQTYAHANTRSVKISCPKNKIAFYLDGKNLCLDVAAPITNFNEQDLIDAEYMGRSISNETSSTKRIK